MSKNVKLNNKFENLQSKVSKNDSNLFLESIVEEIFNSSRFPKKFCPACENYTELFLPFNGRKRVSCPECESLERHRFLYYFLKYKTSIFSKKINFLDLSSESPIKNNLPKNINYYELIGNNKDNFFKSKKLPFKNNSFDVIYSYYVFDNNYYDSSILKEISRVLKSIKESFFILYVVDLNNAHEDVDINNHEKIYGYNFVRMLNESGLNAKLYSISSLIDDVTIQKYGLSNHDHLFICTKKNIKSSNKRFRQV